MPTPGPWPRPRHPAPAPARPVVDCRAARRSWLPRRGGPARHRGKLPAGPLHLAAWNGSRASPAPRGPARRPAAVLGGLEGSIARLRAAQGLGPAPA
ncbi:MAG: hypothetical protein OXG81_13835 [Acidobacteria bacterium]|nr:hypothetical protein [Acidobacteriota bacterium]